MSVNILDRFEKQPGETIDYFVDFGPWFAGRPPRVPARVDSPDTFEVTTTSGVVIEDSAINGSVVKVVVSGGESGRNYLVTVRLRTTSNPPIVKEADFVVSVLDAA